VIALIFIIAEALAGVVCADGTLVGYHEVHLCSQHGGLAFIVPVPQEEHLPLPVLDDEVIQHVLYITGSPLAVDALPYAMLRYHKGAGHISPESAVERFAQKIIDRSGGSATFKDFAVQASKKYFHYPHKRREALAYYGAYMCAKSNCLSER
jgi:hypothetical protein